MFVLYYLGSRKTKALISLHRCAGWSESLLFAYGLRQAFSWRVWSILCCACEDAMDHWLPIKCPAMTHIRLCRCAGWSFTWEHMWFVGFVGLGLIWYTILQNMYTSSKGMVVAFTFDDLGDTTLHGTFKHYLGAALVQLFPRLYRWPVFCSSSLSDDRIQACSKI